MKHFNKFTNCTPFHCKESKLIPTTLFGAANLLPVLLFLPFYDRVIYTWLSGWKWFSMLVRIIFILVSILSAIVIEEVVSIDMQSETLRENGTITINVTAFHKGAGSFEVASPLSTVYVMIPFFFFAFA